MHRFQRLDIHPDNPQPRLLRQAAELLRGGAVAALPSVCGYLPACRLDDKAASQRLLRLAGLQPRDLPALLCRDLAQAARYLRIDDQAYRAIRQRAPGTASFALPCTRRVPRRLTEGSRGLALLYFAGHAATAQLLDALDEPLLLAPPPEGAGAPTVDALPPAWRDLPDLALDAGPIPALPAFAPRGRAGGDGTPCVAPVGMAA
jgi:tRNA A37 threonylcarbamoyladenosine synthetase subunit TsaC/SUA5/YrdC